NRAEMDLLLASDLDHTSQPAAAWKARVAAFSVLSRAGFDADIRDSLFTAVNTELAQGDSEAALALTEIAQDELQHERQPIGVSGIEAVRAEILAKLGDVKAARRSIVFARESANSIPFIELR